MHESSRKYFGVQFSGWYLVYNTIPFGFKSSAFIYNSIGLVATSRCRELWVPCLQYIDDRLMGEVIGKDEEGFKKAKKALYITCELLIRLGYFIGLSKSVFVPCQFIKFLGFFDRLCRAGFCGS